jgi:hypothetical protein
MPGRDGTGPLGKGPMTGRGAGFCGAGRRAGGGFGRGRQVRNRAWRREVSGVDPEVSDIQSRVEALEAALEKIRSKE